MIVEVQDGFVYKDDAGIVIQVTMPHDPHSMNQHKLVVAALKRICQQLETRIVQYDTEQVQAFERVFGIVSVAEETDLEK